jgi:hypothetical protein
MIRKSNRQGLTKPDVIASTVSQRKRGQIKQGKGLNTYSKMHRKRGARADFVYKPSREIQQVAGGQLYFASCPVNLLTDGLEVSFDSSLLIYFS